MPRRNGTLRRGENAKQPTYSTPGLTMTTDALALAAVGLAVANNDPETLARLAAQLDAEDAERRARLERPEALAEAAQWYAAQGIAVFPLIPRMKTPATKHGFKDATTDPLIVAAWWQENPAYNIGAPTGITFDVIDIDGPVGVANIAPFIEGIRKRTLGTVSTPRAGGLHYYVPPDQSRRNSASNMLAKVDTRSRGGYVVIPPSITDEHGPGRRYTWIQPLGPVT